jgi:hypothetical protein
MEHFDFGFVANRRANKRMYTNSRPALGFGYALLDSIGFLAHKVIFRAAVGDPQRSAFGAFGAFGWP